VSETHCSAYFRITAKSKLTFNDNTDQGFQQDLLGRTDSDCRGLRFLKHAFNKIYGPDGEHDKRPSLYMFKITFLWNIFDLTWALKQV